MCENGTETDEIVKEQARVVTEQQMGVKKVVYKNWYILLSPTKN
jgi:hypothetical protein